jgi:hypothetical protein
MDKHSSLLQAFVNYKRIKFYNIWDLVSMLENFFLRQKHSEQICLFLSVSLAEWSLNYLSLHIKLKSLVSYKRSSLLSRLSGDE